jgi:DNA-binding MltR family transcriptional regulator
MGNSNKQRQLLGVVQEVDDFLLEIQGETDRGAALVGGAYLDALLAGMLRAHFVDDCRVVDDLLGVDRPLGSYGTRTRITFVLGLIRRDQFDDLQTIGTIRNAFGHRHGRLNFEDQPVCDYVKRLQQLGHMETLRSQMSPDEQALLIDRFQTLRQQFFGTVLHIAIGLIVRGGRLQHIQPGRGISSEEGVDLLGLANKPKPEGA